MTRHPTTGEVDREIQTLHAMARWLLTSKTGPWVLIAFLLLGSSGGAASLARAFGIQQQPVEMKAELDEIKMTLAKLTGQLDERKSNHGRRADDVERRLEKLEERDARKR